MNCLKNEGKYKIQDTENCCHTRIKASILCISSQTRNLCSATAPCTGSSGQHLGARTNQLAPVPGFPTLGLLPGVTGIVPHSSVATVLAFLYFLLLVFCAP